MTDEKSPQPETMSPAQREALVRGLVRYFRKIEEEEERKKALRERTRKR